jgi:hypothetical protein
MSLTATGLAGAAEIAEIIGGNSANNSLLKLDFEDGTATQLNDDATSLASIRSFDFFDDVCRGRLDTIVADSNRGDILLYPNGAGTGERICENGDGISCPRRPDGISLSDKRTMAIGETSGGGVAAAIYLFAPEKTADDRPNCGDFDGYGPFRPAVSTGQLVLDDGSDTPIGSILDTEFVRVPGGGLNAGDLVFISDSPVTISRLKKEEIDSLLRGAPFDGKADVLVSTAELSGVDPAALAFIPNSAGVGTNDDLSESEDLLVAGTNGLVGQFRFRSLGGMPTISEFNNNYLGVDLGNGPLGIAAGILKGETFLVVAVRNGGLFLKVPLEDVGDNAPDVQPVACDDSQCSNWPIITDGVQNPQGAAVNTKAVAGDDCDGGAGDEGDPGDQQDGCNIRNTLSLLYSQDIEVCQNPGNDPSLPTDPLNCIDDDTILAGIQVVPDPRNGALESISFADLELDGDYVVPANCQGLQLADDGQSVLVVANITKSFAIEPANTVQITEQVTKILPQLADCNQLGTRIYYRIESGNLSPEGLALHDITVNCANPSRSVGPDNSPTVFCRDPRYDPTRKRGPKGKDAAAFQADTAELLSYLESNINEVSGQNSLPDLTALQTYIDNARALLRKKKWVEIAAEMTAGACSVYDMKAVFNSATVYPYTVAYGDLLGRFLATAFFTYETTYGGDYCAPGLDLGIGCGQPTFACP